MAKLPSARTLERCRKLGMIAGVTERFNSFTKTRHDLFGFIDIVAIGGGDTIGIQATSGTNTANRVTKIITECTEDAQAWLKAGNRIQVWGWRKLKVKRGGKAVRWEPDIKEVTLEMLEGR